MPLLTTGLKESQTKIIELTDLSDNVVNELLSYLYGQEINISQMHHAMAFELLRAAHKYNIVSLEHDMMETLLSKADVSYEIDIVLALYYFTVNIEEMHALCDKAINILKKNPEDLESSSAYRDLMEKDPKEAAKLAFKLLRLVSN
ncbi:BTB and MATH domain-containing protein 40 [Orchesella cincta]|uniref:BTB and MATH domain-containing protein 40 n=1 Tax=Orchesella cincta TaxID=48709 RepID=A0A1D2M4J3_ORCCI|nr:BTB and MATH domain-containing protein 40 [Orchesella cincta]